MVIYLSGRQQKNGASQSAESINTVLRGASRCREDRKSLVIPADADKPGDPRKQKKQSASHKLPNLPELFPGFMPLMNTAFEPGHCVETIEKMNAGPKKDIALAEYHYFSGQAEKAMQETEVYLTDSDGAIRLSACWIFAYSCLTMGRIDHARHALQEIQNTLADSGKTAPSVRAIEAFVAFAAAVLLHLPLPEKMPPMETFLPLLPPGLRGFALYVLARLSLSERGIRTECRNCRGYSCYGSRRLPHLCYLSAFGGSNGLYEFKAAGSCRDPSSDSVGDRPSG